MTKKICQKYVKTRHFGVFYLYSSFLLKIIILTGIYGKYALKGKACPQSERLCGQALIKQP